MSISLRPVNKSNLGAVLRLKVAASQSRLVADNAGSIAQAHYSDHAWFRAIYADDTPVGFVMLSDDSQVPADQWEGDTEPELWLWRFMIGESYQRRGYGAAAMQCVLEHAKARACAHFKLGYVPEDGNAASFYKALGFVETGEVEDGEIIMHLPGFFADSGGAPGQPDSLAT